MSSYAWPRTNDRRFTRTSHTAVAQAIGFALGQVLTHPSNRLRDHRVVKQLATCFTAELEQMFKADNDSFEPPTFRMMIRQSCEQETGVRPRVGTPRPRMSVEEAMGWNQRGLREYLAAHPEIPPPDMEACEKAWRGEPFTERPGDVIGGPLPPPPDETLGRDRAGNPLPPLDEEDDEPDEEDDEPDEEDNG